MNRFSSADAQGRWDRFAARLDGALAMVDGADRDELRREIEGHALDAYEAGAGDEDARLRDALARLGDPADFLRPMITDRLVEEGTHGFRPVPLTRGLLSMVAQGGKAALLGLTFLILYVCLGVFAAMAVLKPVLPTSLGLFRHPNGQIDFGFVSDTAGSVDLIGLWAMPLGLALAALTWWLLGRLLRAARR